VCLQVASASEVRVYDMAIMMSPARDSESLRSHRDRDGAQHRD
jgi:hypothetical protein